MGFLNSRVSWLLVRDVRGTDLNWHVVATNDPACRRDNVRMTDKLSDVMSHEEYRQAWKDVQFMRQSSVIWIQIDGRIDQTNSQTFEGANENEPTREENLSSDEGGD